ncbi:hypothetical protein F5I97DRAFT_1830577 [Phlebopus sp. FC_14]|nr:hypothetical protein F5I97DRAFT_1830577 [Phlebopus sp. FC_14]
MPAEFMASSYILDALSTASESTEVSRHLEGLCPPSSRLYAQPSPVPGLKINGEQYKGPDEDNPKDLLSDNEDTNLQSIIDRTYASSIQRTNFSKREERINDLDHPEDRVTSSGYYGTGTSFYNDNATAIKQVTVKAADALKGDSNIKALEDGIRTFAESSKVLMKILDEVAKVHPFIGVAVLAFKAVVTLELKRRDNDKLVIALKVEMKNMMSILLQLRYVRDSKQILPDGTTLEGRMQQLMKDIADDITNCGNVCDAYTKKSLVAKVFKGPLWEGRLAEFADTFAKRRQEIELSLSIHTTLGVDDANRTLSDLQDGLRSVHQKMDLLLLFKKLETPAAKEVAKFVEMKGGQAACSENDDLLQSVIIAGRNAQVNGKDLPSSAFGAASKSKGSTVDPHILAVVRKELAEDIDKALVDNMELFDRKLRVQQKQLVEQLDHVVHREGDRIITAVISGSHDRLLDPDLHKLWKDMGWKGSVKARHFILALHDYFLDKVNDSHEENIATPVSMPSPLLPDEYSDPGSALDVAIMVPQTRTSADDHWALSYINITRIQPILEAFDDDGSGFVSIKEANAFTSSRPKGWSLPHWLAYWAAGWHSITWEYASKIRRVIQTMYDHLPSVHPANQSQVDLYLNDVPLQQVELLCASVRICEDEIYQDEKIKPYMQDEQARIEANLESMAWNIDATNTLALVVGPGRIERYIFPLLYLLLKHHLKIIKLACKGIFADNVLSVASGSMARVMIAVFERITNLEAHFKQKGLDVKIQFESIAFGMFRLLHDGDTSDLEEDCDPSYDSNSEDVPDDSISPSILKNGFIEQLVDYSKYESADIVDDTIVQIPMSGDGIPEIRGTWSGRRYRKGEALPQSENAGDDGTFFYMTFTVDPDDGRLQGECFEGGEAFSLEGSVKRIGSDVDAFLEVNFRRRLDEDEQGIIFKGRLNPISAVISGEWSPSGFDNQAEESPSPVPFTRPNSPSQSQDPDADNKLPDECHDSWEPLGTVVLMRCPPYAQRYRYSSQEFQWSAARARWQFAGASVLHQVRRSSWSWEYFKGRAEERKRFIRLWTRRELDRLWPGMDAEENEEGGKDLDGIMSRTGPADLAFWQSLANERVRKYPVHSNVYCDSCYITILGARTTCLTCNASNFRQQIDLCTSCSELEVVTDNFAHEQKHPVVKMRRVMYSKGAGALIRFSRKASERASDIMRLVEKTRGEEEQVSEGEGTEATESAEGGNRSHTNSTQDDTDRSESRASSNELSTANNDDGDDADNSSASIESDDSETNTDAFVCDNCDSDEQESFIGPHDISHPIVRCREPPSDLEHPRPRPDSEQRIAELESKIVALDERIAGLEKRFEGSQSMLVEKLSGIEALLSKVVSSLAT